MPDRKAEDIASTAIHALAALCGVAGLVVLLHGVAAAPGWRADLSMSLYGGSLILAFTSSALYHGIRHPGARAFLQALDHCAIFLLIAGSYTPFALIALWDHWGGFLAVAVWSVALIGIAIRLLWLRRLYRFAPALYLALGWVIVPWAKALVDTVGWEALALVVAGGFAYSAGLVFFAWRRLPFGNAIWHLFTVLGGALHFWAVIAYVAPFALPDGG